jgi:hypothetical protein
MNEIRYRYPVTIINSRSGYYLISKRKFRLNHRYSGINNNYLCTGTQIFFNFRNICVSVAVFRHILQNILQYITKDRDTHILRKLKKIWESGVLPGLNVNISRYHLIQMKLSRQLKKVIS